MTVKKMNKQDFMKFFDDMKEDKEYIVKVHKSKFGKALGVEGDVYGYFLEQLGDDYINPISKACEFAKTITIEKTDGSTIDFQSVDCAYRSTFDEQFLVIKHQKQSDDCITLINMKEVASVTSSRPKMY